MLGLKLSPRRDNIHLNFAYVSGEITPWGQTNFIYVTVKLSEIISYGVVVWAIYNVFVFGRGRRGLRRASIARGRFFRDFLPQFLQKFNLHFLCSNLQ